MSFSSFTEFVQMGGHGLYVWISYATALLVVVFNIVRPLQMRRQFFIGQAKTKGGAKCIPFVNRD